MDGVRDVDADAAGEVPPLVAVALEATSGGDNEGDFVCGDAALGGERCFDPHPHGGGEVGRAGDGRNEKGADDGVGGRSSGVLRSIEARACVVGARDPPRRTYFADGIVRHFRTWFESPGRRALGHRVILAGRAVCGIGKLTIRAHLTERISLCGRRSEPLAFGTHNTGMVLACQDVGSG